eukprot:7313528-Prymnesium_polylepis.1
MPRRARARAACKGLPAGRMTRTISRRCLLREGEPLVGELELLERLVEPQAVRERDDAPGEAEAARGARMVRRSQRGRDSGQRARRLVLGGLRAALFGGSSVGAEGWG